MRSLQNPFRSRASEQLRESSTFLRTFGPGALALLPASLWDRLVILRSAPGGGKTSLMRLFAAESLKTISQREDFGDLGERLCDIGAITSNSVSVVGALLSLDKEYLSLLDVSPSSATSRRVFFHILDARIMMSFLRASLALADLRFPEDLVALTFESKGPDHDIELAASRLGGTRGDSIYERCRDVEDAILIPLDSLLPTRWEDSNLGHLDMYSLHFLSHARLCIHGKPQEVTPLIMFDDGHNLGEAQREDLLKRLSDRSLEVARWYSERYEALSSQEILDSVGKDGRDFVLVELERVARGEGVDGLARFRPGQFERVLSDIANRRAYLPLTRYTEQKEDFSVLLDIEEDQLLGDSGESVVEELRKRLYSVSNNEARYREWLLDAQSAHDYQAALRLREMEVLIVRDKARIQPELFDVTLDSKDVRERSSSGVREAAALALSKEFGLPYYAGPEMIPKLGSHNVEQFLSLCGDLFEEMLARITMQERPRLSALRQDRIIKRASDSFWRDIPRRVPNGYMVQHLVEAIVAMAEDENRKASVPYPPGVTGTALSMLDRSRLLNEEARKKIPGAEELLIALSEGVAH